MPYQVEFLRSAARELASLPKRDQERLARLIDGLVENPRPLASKKLEETLYRLRAGDYRVLYEINDESKVVTVTKVGHRRDIYRHL